MKTTTPLPFLLALAAALVPGAASRDAQAQRPSSKMGSAALGTPGARERFVIANPLVSRGKRVTGWSSLHFAEPRNVDDGDPWTIWGAGRPTPERSSWVAIDVGRGPRRLLLVWSAAGSFNYEETDYGSPGAYRIATSADSTDGSDGAWKVVASVPEVVTHGQAHSFDFAGQRWVKMVITKTPAVSPNGVQIDEIGVHDLSAGTGDTWFFMGDSITATFGRPPAGGQGFAARVAQRHPGYRPAVINGGVGGDKSDDGVRRVDDWLARNPDAHFWAIGYGTNDAAGDAADASRFKANMQTIIDRVRGAGRVPILARIPFASDGQHRHVARFNDAIDDLQRANGLPRGPDLYAWFAAHPEELRDGLHPGDRGVESINRLWAEAVDALYPP